LQENRREGGDKRERREQYFRTLLEEDQGPPNMPEIFKWGSDVETLAKAKLKSHME